MKKFDQIYHNILQDIKSKQRINLLNEQKLTWNNQALNNNLLRLPSFDVKIPFIYKKQGKRYYQHYHSFETWFQSNEAGKITVYNTNKVSVTPKKITNWITPFEIAYTVSDEFNHERNFFQKIGDKFKKQLPSSPVLRFMVDDIIYDIQNGINSALKEYTNEIFKYRKINLYPQVKIDKESGIMSLIWSQGSNSDKEELIKIFHDYEWDKKISLKINENIKSNLSRKIKIKLEQWYDSQK